jgi:hypothetical protein
MPPSDDPFIRGPEVEDVYGNAASMEIAATAEGLRACGSQECAMQENAALPVPTTAPSSTT